MDAIVLAVKSLWEQIPTVVTQLPTIELIYVILFVPVLVAAFACRASTFCCAVLLASLAHGYTQPGTSFFRNRP
jgi:hypothetical protein